MKTIFTIIIIFSISFLYGCGKKKEKKIILDSTDIESQMIEAYNKGLEALEEGDALFAAKNCPNYTKHLNTYLARIAKEKD